jgi:uncharacterized membrane protein YdjX (TVP38/TMEM64 family)
MGPGVGLIWADLVLPIPQTAVIAALGIIYGRLLGGLLGSLGLITSGLLGYLLMLTSARRCVQLVVGGQSLRKMEGVFERGGTFAWRVSAEETLLSRTFGERYVLYRRQTKMIIPHLF